MRIVLLGATGFVGRHLLPELSRRGHTCVLACRNTARCGNLRLIPAVELRPVPALTPESLAELLAGADLVINLVGILNERGRNGSGFRKIHVGIVENLIEACRIAGVRRLIQMSALNAGKGKSHYLISKGMAEERLKNAGHIDAVIVQPSVIFGEGDAFFNRFAALLKRTPVLPLACPRALLQPVWIGDVTRAIGIVVDDPGISRGNLEMTGPQVYTLIDLVRLTARICGLRRWILGLPDLMSRLQAWVMDFVPGKPFSSDNYKSLQLANISKHNDLLDLGITPMSINTVVPAYLRGTTHQRHLDDWRQHSGVG